MRSTISSRGQTVIPAETRRRFKLGPADRLEWILEQGQIRVIPVREDPAAAFRARGKGGAPARLPAEHQADGETE
jgi:AbrB family looped-hinge helix DNA binding protein